MSKRITTITVSMLALLFMLATPSFAQRVDRPVKAKKTSAFELANNKAELFKKYPALQNARTTLRQENSVLKNTVVGQLQKIDRKALKAGDGTILTGNMTYDATEALTLGLYEFASSENPEFKEINTNKYFSYNNAGGAVVDGVYYFVEYFSFFGMVFTYTYAYDINNDEWLVEEEGSDYVDIIADGANVAYDAATGKTYGVFYNAALTGLEFGTIDYTTFTRTGVLPTPAHMEEYINMASDGKGNLYAATLSGEIYKVDPTTGGETLVASTGMTVDAYIQGATLNAKNNVYYWSFLANSGTSAGIAEVNLTTGETNVVPFPSVYEFNMINVPAPAAEPNAPAAVDNLKAYIENAAPNNVFVSFVLPTKTYDGESDLTGILEYSILVNGEEALKGSGQPGAQVIHKIENVPTGNTTITVIPRSVVGNGAKATTKLWVGADAPASPDPATLAIEGDKATVTWTAPTMEGVHGGYVNTSNVTYTVTRYPDKVVVAEGISETTFEETVDISSLKVYSYGITANYGEASSVEAITNRVKVGDAIVPPFKEDFMDPESASLIYTALDLNNDASSWSLGTGFARYTYNGKNSGDDWLLTPDIKLQTGKLYIVSFTVGSYSSSYPERLEVMMGQGQDPTAYGITLLEPTDFTDGMPHTYEVPVTVEADGTFNIGFHAISDADMFYMEVYGWSISSPLDFGAPALSTNMEVVPGAKGALNATINFNAPTKTINDEALSEITKMVLKNQKGEVEAEFENPAPGAALSAAVTVEDNGIYTYTVTGYNSKGEGLTASASAFIGVDTPAGLENIAGRDNFDGTATITWAAHTDKGANGGYVDPESVTYRVYAVENGNLGDVLAETKDLQYVLASDAIQEGPEGLVQVGLSAFVGDAEGPIYAGAVVGGDANTLPYAESFPNQSVSHYWWVETLQGNTWNIYTDSSDEDGGCAGFVAGSAGASGTLNTAKISVKGAASPKLIFDWAAVPGDDLKVSVLGNRQDGSAPVVLKEIDVKNLTGDLEWHTEVVDLSAFTSDPYVILSFLAEAGEAGVAFEFDNLLVNDFYANDLFVELTAPRSVAAGDELTATAVVGNSGENNVAAGEYSVVFSVNGKEFATVTETPALAAYRGVNVVQATYKPTLFDEGMMNIKAEVVFDRDLDVENNVAERSVNLKVPALARVNDLTAETGGWPAVQLKWSAPVQQASEGTIITEDFEDQTVYEPFSVGGITTDIHTGMLGQWKVVDGNNGTGTYAVNGYANYANCYAPMGFQVFNPELAGFDLSDPAYATMVAPNSGSQMLTSWCIQGVTDHWLISPLLSGDAQTISFFASAPTLDYGNELYEIYVSSSDNEVTSFEILAEGEVSSTDWNEFTYELPAGTKYFAIRHTSNDVFALEIDDVTYTSSSSKKFVMADGNGVTAYNIYRDGKVIATVDANTTSYIDVNETDGEHTYYVTAVYGDVESGLSNGATVVTAITELTSDASLMDADITVYSTSGAMIASGKGVYGRLEKGVYVIKNNETGAVKGVSKK